MDVAFQISNEDLILNIEPCIFGIFLMKNSQNKTNKTKSVP